jgi:D-aminopeptidase
MAGEFTVGVLVQANHGVRRRFEVLGAPVGLELDTPAPSGREGAGSIIVVVATDAPLLPHQCARIATRAGLGVARLGGAGENSSGDLFVAFATGNRGLGGAGAVALRLLPNDALDAFFYATIDATEEAILNALLSAETMTGKDGCTVHALDADALVESLRRHGRI